MVKTPEAERADVRERARACLPGGVNSNIRLECASQFFDRAEGAWLWDLEGNDYVDYALGQGPMFLGHANPVVNAAVAKACARGMVYSAQHPLEVEAAEKMLRALGWAERVRLGLTGSEAIQAVLRIARAVTSREKVVRFVGHYHGWMDNVLMPLDTTSVDVGSVGQLPEALLGTIIAPWNDLAALGSVLDAHGSEVAAVLMEPVMFNVGAIEPLPGFLEGVRQLCTDRGIVLIFDEVITGFRVALGGASERYGVVPDLATYGKAMAGGWPVAAFAGKAELMDVLSDGRVNHSGTFNGSVMAAAAVIATLSILEEDPPYPSIAAYGSRMMSDLVELAGEHGVTLRTDGLPMAFTVAVDREVHGGQLGGGTGAKPLAMALHRAFADAGIWTTTRGLWFVSATHGDDERQATLGRAAKALAALGASLGVAKP